jgi:hypothetical protein
MYRPFSVKALGSLFLPPQLEVEIFDFKFFHSPIVNPSTKLNKISGINHMVDFTAAKVKITFGFSKYFKRKQQ